MFPTALLVLDCKICQVYTLYLTREGKLFNFKISLAVSLMDVTKCNDLF